MQQATITPALSVNRSSFSWTESTSLVTWAEPAETAVTTAAAEGRNGIKRWYDPVSGRWLTREPLGEAGSINLYSYCFSDPINNFDPDGRKVYVTGHQVSGSGLILKPSTHLAILVIPDNPADFAGNPNLKTDASGKKFFTISAAPGGWNNNQLHCEYNRGTDSDNAKYGLVSSTFSDTDLIKAFIAGADAFIARQGNNPLNYDLFPEAGTDGYNSNSFLSGLLQAAGGTAPSGVSKKPDLNFPGFSKPVPGVNFVAP